VSSSAGGQIMLAMLLRAHADGLPMPAALSMYTPASDISGVGDSSIANDGRDVVPLKLSLALMQQNYLNDDDATSPQVSPLYADYPVDFPPTVISTGTRDLLLSNCVRLFWKIKGAGVKSELLVMEGGWHGFNWEPDLAEAKQARAAVRDFVVLHLQGK
jgi:monoterpene epsilon-lactone hydrolase